MRMGKSRSPSSFGEAAGMQPFMPPTWTWVLATRSALTGWVSCGG